MLTDFAGHRRLAATAEQHPSASTAVLKERTQIWRMEDLSQPRKLRKQKKSAARLEKPTFRAKTLKRRDPLAVNHG